MMRFPTKAGSPQADGILPRLFAPANPPGRTSHHAAAGRRAPEESPAVGGWHDSSWALRQGLEVTEDVPPAVWPAEWRQRWAQ